MAKQEIKVGFVDYTTLVFIPDPASTDGSGKTGLVAANLTVSGVRVETDNDVTVTDYTGSLNNLAALTTAHTDWGLLEVSSTLAPGLYRLDIADAIFASGAWSSVVYVMITTSAAAASPMEFTLVAYDINDGVRLGLTALPNAAADAAGGLVISDAGGLDADAQRADVAAILVDTGTTLDARIPVALVGGRMDASTGAMAANVLTAAATAADFTTEIQAGLATPTNITAGTITTVTNLTNAPTSGDLTATMKTSVTTAATAATPIAASVTGAVGSVTGNVGGNVIGTVASVVGAVGSVTAGVTVTTNNDKAGYALSSAGVSAVWAEVITGTTTAVQAMRGFLAVLLGKASGLATTTAVYRNIADTKDVVTATVDSDGNRSAVTRDLT